MPCAATFIAEELKDGWARLTYGGLSGWTNMNYMCSFIPDMYYKVSATNDERTMLRDAPDDNGGPLEILENDTIVYMTQYQSGWGYAYCPGDMSGWLKMCDMQLAPQNQ